MSAAGLAQSAGEAGSSAQSPEAQLAEGLTRMSITADAVTQGRLIAYAKLLHKWNRTYNLTALRDAEQMISHHLLDSLAILPWVEAGTLADIGSGGGMPGIPLAILRPDVGVTLVESNAKKGAFLQQALIELGLDNARVVCGRVEAWQPQAGQRMVTSRAFASLADFVTATRHLPAADGRWLAMKGLYPEAEIAALPADIMVETVHALQVPGVVGARHLLILREK